MEGGGRGKSKNSSTENKQKKIRAPELFEKKNSCRDFSIGKIISWQGLSEVQCKESKCPPKLEN
jgi:hypothetical protein